jgi:hypothetical protein
MGGRGLQISEITSTKLIEYNVWKEPFSVQKK